jgi:hypothetical protein
MHDGHSAHGGTPHDHDHEHSHDCGRPHEHGGGQAGEPGPFNIAKMAAVLDYAFAHNEQHIEEMHNLALEFRHAGFKTVADAINAAAVDFSVGNEKLRDVIHKLKEAE